jgi:hypothetical protein
MDKLLDYFRSLSEFKDSYEKLHGTDVQVRLRTDFVFEARDKTGMTYRELAVLSAIYSSIGAKPYPVRITRDAIIRRALGYKSATVMAAEFGRRSDDAKPLTYRQITYTANHLHQRRLFARARPNERQTYYSNRLTQDQIEKQIFERKTAGARFENQRKKRNRDLMDRIKFEHLRLAGS